MKRAILLFVLALSAAQPFAVAEPPPSPSPSPPGIGFSEKRAPAAARWGDGKTGRGPQPIAEPAKGSAYNLTHIVYASAIMLAMLALTIWLIRRNRRPD